MADRFPKAKSNLWLARRLGNNISKQRKIIQYRQEHRASLAKESEQSRVGDTATVIATTYHEIDDSATSHQVPKVVSSSGMSAFTSATSFQSLGDEEGMGRPIPDLSDMTLDGVQLQYGEPFECPYCRTIQVAANRYEWKSVAQMRLPCFMLISISEGMSSPTFNHICVQSKTAEVVTRRSRLEVSGSNMNPPSIGGSGNAAGATRPIARFPVLKRSNNISTILTRDWLQKLKCP